MSDKTIATSLLFTAKSAKKKLQEINFHIPKQKQPKIK